MAMLDLVRFVLLSLVEGGGGGGGSNRRSTDVGDGRRLMSGGSVGAVADNIGRATERTHERRRCSRPGVALLSALLERRIGDDGERPTAPRFDPLPEGEEGIRRTLPSTSS